MLPFVAVTAAVVARDRAAARRSAGGWRHPRSRRVILVVLTAVFDNLMIAAGLFTYPPEHLSGLRIGLAPIEDFSYAVCAAFLVPAVYTLLARAAARERT